MSLKSIATINPKISGVVFFGTQKRCQLSNVCILQWVGVNTCLDSWRLNVWISKRSQPTVTRLNFQQTMVFCQGFEFSLTTQSRNKRRGVLSCFNHLGHLLRTSKHQNSNFKERTLFAFIKFWKYTTYYLQDN